VRRVLTALDVTEATVERAVAVCADVILSHHPLLFHPLHEVVSDAGIGRRIARLFSAGISVMSFHTRLDALEGGVNDSLAKALGLSEIEVFEGEGMPIGRVGELDGAMSLEDFAKQVKNALGCPFVLVSDAGLKVKRVAVLGGEGRDFIAAAKSAGADTYLSGRLDYHSMTDAPDAIDRPINLIEAGHFYTENPVCEVLRRFVADADLSVECDVYCSNVIKAI
jgi:dinuclear metal center YbgI/SA1388 family protein